MDPAASVDLDEVVKDFLADYRARDVAKSTRYRYRHFLADYASWLADSEVSTDMSTLQGKRGFRCLQGYLTHLRERGAAPGTVATAYRVLKAFWNWTARESLDEIGEPNSWPYVHRAPTDFFTRGDVPKDRVADEVGEPFTEEEVKRILAAIGPANSPSLEVLRNRAIVHVLLAAGVRRKELTGLLVADFNPETGVIVVRRSTAKQTRRDDDARLTTLYGEAWREVSRFVRRLKGTGLGSGPLFPSLKGGQVEHRGKHLRPDSITRLLSRLIDGVQAACPEKARHRSGGGCSSCVRYTGVHRLRNTWAINQLARGVSPSAVKAAGGWSSYEMLDRYSRKARAELAVAEIRRVNSGR